MTFLHSRRGLPAWALAVLFSVACGGSSTPEPSPEPAPPAAPAAPENPDVNAKQLEEHHEKIALVPSPVETQQALEAAGIDMMLSDLIPKHAFDLDKADIDRAAIRTGVILADALLTVKSAEKAELVGRLQTLRKGMNQLNGGDDIDATLKDMLDRVKSDAVTRDELLKEFDELSGAVIPELEFNGNDRVVPLIEAGSWLEGANLVAKAIKRAEAPDAANALLKQPAVVDYFLQYVEGEGADKAPESVNQKLKASLTTLKELASKAEPLTKADVKQVIQVTSDVLALL